MDALILDLVMPPSDGMDGLKGIRDLFPALPVILLSGHGTIANAVEAIKIGAFDFWKADRMGAHPDRAGERPAALAAGTGAQRLPEGEPGAATR